MILVKGELMFLLVVCFFFFLVISYFVANFSYETNSNTVITYKNPTGGIVPTVGVNSAFL